MPKERSIVGDLINFRGLVYGPMNENGVIFLFGKVIEDLNMYIEEIKPGFPDCIARRFTGRGWEKVLIEFEFRSSHFQDHKHDPKGCDIVVCWEHNWPECPPEVIELRNVIKGLPSKPISTKGRPKPPIVSSAGISSRGGRKPHPPGELYIDNNQYSITNWYEVLVIVANWIIDQGKKLPLGKKYGAKILVSRNPGELESPKHLKNGHWINTKYDRQQTINKAAMLLRDCGLDTNLYVETEEKKRIRPKGRI